MLRLVRRCAVDVLASLVALRATGKHEFLSRAGVNPFCSVSPSGGLTAREARRRLRRPGFLVPNLSGFYHDILRAWWEIHGLGVRCLLVSETRAVARVFQGSWPGTRFVTTDLHVELQSQPECDFVWDLCSTAPPDGHREAFSSVICQATLEHVLDPVQALRNLAGVLHPGGMLYVQTHTSAYPYHGYPRDHLRYFPDWFQDVGDLLGTLSLVELLCVDGHAFAAYRRR